MWTTAALGLFLLVPASVGVQGIERILVGTETGLDGSFASRLFIDRRLVDRDVLGAPTWLRALAHASARSPEAKLLACCSTTHRRYMQSFFRSQRSSGVMGFGMASSTAVAVAMF